MLKAISQDVQITKNGTTVTDSSSNISIAKNVLTGSIIDSATVLTAQNSVNDWIKKNNPDWDIQNYVDPKGSSYAGSTFQKKK